MICKSRDIEEYLSNQDSQEEAWCDLYNATMVNILEEDNLNEFLEEHQEVILDLIKAYIIENTVIISLGEDFGQSDRDIELANDFMYDLVKSLTEKFTETIEKEVSLYKINLERNEISEEESKEILF